MDPNYCSSCAEVHNGGKAECPKSREHYVQYTQSKNWACPGNGPNDLKQVDLKPGMGYPDDPGHSVQGRIAARGEKFEIMAAMVDKFDNGEPNCKIHAASMLGNSIKGGGSGGNHGSSPIDRETQSIRQSNKRRLVIMHSYAKDNKRTGIPTIDGYA